jgi:hypothetical protein
MAVESYTFADALAGRAAYPVSGGEMIATIAAFEVVVVALGTNR